MACKRSAVRSRLAPPKHEATARWPRFLFNPVSAHARKPEPRQPQLRPPRCAQGRHLGPPGGRVLGRHRPQRRRQEHRSSRSCWASWSWTAAAWCGPPPSAASAWATTPRTWCPSTDGTVLEETLAAFGDVEATRREMHELEHRMAEPGVDLEAVMARYQTVQEHFERLDGFTIRARAEGILFALGFTPEHAGEQGHGAVRRAEVPGDAGQGHPPGPGPAAAGRAHQPPGPALPALAGVVHQRHPGRRGRHQPRPLLPGPHRHLHPGDRAGPLPRPTKATTPTSWRRRSRSWRSPSATSSASRTTSRSRKSTSGATSPARTPRWPGAGAPTWASWRAWTSRSRTGAGSSSPSPRPSAAATPPWCWTRSPWAGTARPCSSPSSTSRSSAARSWPSSA